MGFILIDFKKQQERRDLQTLVSTNCKKLDDWIVGFENDGTPPTEDECVELETAKIAEVLGEFAEEAAALTRVKEEAPKYQQDLAARLERRKGRLYGKFASSVAALQDQAAFTMKFCMDALQEYEKSLNQLMPTTEEAVEAEFSKLMTDCEEYINASFPEGVTGLDSYDDVLPEGIPSYEGFKAKVEEKKAEMMVANKESIPGAIEKIKAASQKRIKAAINEAIKGVVAEITEDLSDDTLPYMEEEAMAALRQELIEAATAYGESRLDTEE